MLSTKCLDFLWSSRVSSVIVQVEKMCPPSCSLRRNDPQYQKKNLRACLVWDFLIKMFSKALADKEQVRVSHTIPLWMLHSNQNCLIFFPLGVNGPSWFFISTAIICILALMLPTQGEKDSSLPEYLLLSNQQKLIAAYVLGQYYLLHSSPSSLNP